MPPPPPACLCCLSFSNFPFSSLFHMSASSSEQKEASVVPNQEGKKRLGENKRKKYFQNTYEDPTATRERKVCQADTEEDEECAETDPAYNKNDVL